MEDIDDDFGDLYADVEVQASNTFTEFARLYTEQYDNKFKGSEPCPEKGHAIAEELIQSSCDDETNKIKSVDGNGEKEVFVDNGSDSEDDLNIVLNDDENGLAYPTVSCVNLRSGGFDDVEEEGGGDFVVAEGNGSSKSRIWVDQSQLGDGLDQASNGTGGGDRGMGARGGYHSQYKYIRSQTVAFTCNSKANGPLGSTPLVRGDWENNGSNQHIGMSSAVAIDGCNFSLPRHRTILDVNIDTFEWRPWRHPGADTTDFFNFGFNEESWKHYCSCLEQFRHQTSMGSRKTVSEPLGPSEMKDREVGLEHDTVAQGAVTGKIAQVGWGIAVPPLSKFSNGETKQPRGRAIQVKDSTAERQPSFDLMRPLDLNSDVVIQITLQDSAKDSIGSGKKEVVHMDSSAQKASETRDTDLEDSIDIHCSRSSSEDEFYRDSLEGNAKRIQHADVPERCCQSTAATYPVSMDSDDHGSGHSSDVNGYHCQKISDCTPVEDTEAIEASNSTKERMGRDTSNTVPSIVEIESSLAERSHCWPSSSGSHCETPHDGDFIKPEKYYNHRSVSPPNSVTEFRKLDIFDCYHPKNYKTRCSKRKSDNCIRYSRHRNSIQEDLNLYNKKLHGMSKLRSNMQDDYDASRMSNAKEYADHSTVGHNRKKERLHGFDYSDEEHFSYCRKSELAFSRRGERLSDNQVKTSCRRKPHGKGHQLFEDETDSQPCRNLDEEEYFYNRRIPRMNKVRDGDWSSCGRENIIDDMSHLTCKESRQLVSKHLSYLENEIDARWRRKGDELRYRKRTEDDDFVMERKFRDDFIEEKFQRSVLYNDTGRDYLDRKYERNLPYASCEVKHISRSQKNYGSCSIDLEWSRVDEDDYQRCFTSTCSYKHHTYSGRWHDTALFRNDMYDLRKTGRHGRLRRQILTCRDREWLSSYSDVFDTEEIINSYDDEVHYEGSCHWHSEVFNWPENGCLSMHGDDEFLAGDEFHDEMKSFSVEEATRNRSFDAKHGSGHGRKLIEDRQVLQHRYKMPREGYSGIPIDRSFNITSRGNYKKTFPRCRESVDLPLVFEEGKSSGRCSPAGSLMCNGRPDNNMDRIVYRKQKIARYCNESYKEKAGQSESEVEISQNDEKWHNKFPVTQHNEALDIEEGQIITEESDIVEGCESKAVLPISDRKKRTLCNENASNGKKVEENGNHRILEMLAKMEKRRERFREPIGLKREMDKIPKPVVETAETQQQRPLRKRSWGGR